MGKSCESSIVRVWRGRQKTTDTPQTFAAFVYMHVSTGYDRAEGNAERENGARADAGGSGRTGQPVLVHECIVRLPYGVRVVHLRDQPQDGRSLLHISSPQDPRQRTPQRHPATPRPSHPPGQSYMLRRGCPRGSKPQAQAVRPTSGRRSGCVRRGGTSHHVQSMSRTMLTHRRLRAAAHSPSVYSQGRTTPGCGR
jgi:hypothetical protein